MYYFTCNTTNFIHCINTGGILRLIIPPHRDMLNNKIIKRYLWITYLSRTMSDNLVHSFYFTKVVYFLQWASNLLSEPDYVEYPGPTLKPRLRNKLSAPFIKITNMCKLMNPFNAYAFCFTS